MENGPDNQYDRQYEGSAYCKDICSHHILQQDLHWFYVSTGLQLEAYLQVGEQNKFKPEQTPGTHRIQVVPGIEIFPGNGGKHVWSTIALR